MGAIFYGFWGGFFVFFVFGWFFFFYMEKWSLNLLIVCPAYIAT